MAYSIEYSLIRCCSYCTLCSDILQSTDIIWSLVGLLIDVYVHIFIIGKKVTSLYKTFLHDLVVYIIYLLYIENRRQSRKPLLFV